MLDERKAIKVRGLAAIESLSPALVVEGDPSLRDPGLIDISRARETACLLRLPRVSGKGGPGSMLVASARDYDGRNGGEPRSYVLLDVEFHDGHGYKCRTRGVAIAESELRDVARTLLDYATAIEAAGPR